MEIAVSGAVISVLIFSIILHEIAHGFVAYLNGDPTAQVMKRLTLNPIRHIDLVGTLLLPAILYLAQSPFLLGWAKPVPYNPLNFRNERLGTFTVGIAGVAVNFILAGLFAIALPYFKNSPWLSVFVYGVSINLILAIFNLIPIPPLDGSRVLSAFLSKKAARAFLSIDKIGLFALMALLYFGVLSQVMMSIFNYLFSIFVRS